VQPICEAARRRNVPVILDGDRPTEEDDPLFRLATHVIFSSECLRATTGVADLAAGLERIARKTDAFLAVSNGPNDILFFEGRKLCQLPVFEIAAVDTLGAGDAFHGGFALALAEGPQRGRCHALRRRGRRHQMQPGRRLGRGADPGGSRGFFWRGAKQLPLIPAKAGIQQLGPRFRGMASPLDLE